MKARGERQQTRTRAGTTAPPSVTREISLGDWDDQGARARQRPAAMSSASESAQIEAQNKDVLAQQSLPKYEGVLQRRWR